MDCLVWSSVSSVPERGVSIGSLGNSHESENGSKIESWPLNHYISEKLIDGNRLSDFFESLLSWDSSWVMNWIWNIPVIVSLDKEPVGFVNLVISVDGIWVSLNDNSLVILDTTDSVIDCGGKIGRIEHLDGLVEILGLLENDSQEEIGWNVVIHEEVDANICEGGNSIFSGVHSDGVLSVLYSRKNKRTSNNHLSSSNVLASLHEINSGSHSGEEDEKFEIPISSVQDLVLVISENDS